MAPLMKHLNLCQMSSPCPLMTLSSVPTPFITLCLTQSPLPLTFSVPSWPLYMNSSPPDPLTEYSLSLSLKSPSHSFVAAPVSYPLPWTLRSVWVCFLWLLGFSAGCIKVISCATYLYLPYRLPPATSPPASPCLLCFGARVLE